MKRRNLFLLTLVSFLSIGMVYLLQIFSQKVNHSSNGFIRLFPPHLVSLRKAIDLKYNSYYIAGVSSKHIYLGNFTARANLLITDYSLADTHRIKLRFPENGKQLSNSFNVRIDFPHIYILDGLKPAILHASVDTLFAFPYIYDRTYFIECVPISFNSFALRSFDASIHKNVLLKQSPDTPHIKRSPELLEKQVDGFFCTDGILSYDVSASRLVYVYFYRNQFLCLDTNLNLLYKGRTIDTVSHARIKVFSTDSGKMSTLAAPPLTVNKRSTASKGLLFVYSSLRANNETQEAFNTYSVIDIYILNDGQYKHSIYLNDINNKKLSNFYIRNRTLVAIHDHYLAIYDLNF